MRRKFDEAAKYLLFRREPANKIAKRLGISSVISIGQ
jgi:hypothetical protein